MKSAIYIKGMEFYAYHGCFAEEKKIGTRFKVDVVLHCDVAAAAQGDDLTKTINYQMVYTLVKEEMMIPSDIIENVAYRILSRIKTEYTQVLCAEVTVYKLNPSIGGKTEWVAATLSE